MAHYPLPSAVKGAAPSYSPPAAPPPTYFDVQDRTLAECNQRLDELKETNRKLSVMVESFAADNLRKSQELLEQQHDAPKPPDAAGPATAKPAAGFFENLFKSSKKGGRRTRKRRKNTKKRGGGAGASRMKHTSPPPRQLSQIPHVIPRCHSHAPSPQHTSADLQDLSEQLEAIPRFGRYRIPKDGDDLGATVRPTIPADTAVTRARKRVRARQMEVNGFLKNPNSPAAIAGSPLPREGPNNVAKLMELMGLSSPSPKTSIGGARTRKRRRQRRTRKSRTKGNRKRSIKNKRRNKRQSRR